MTETATGHTGHTGHTGDSGQASGVRAAAHDAGEQARSIAETGKEEATKVVSEVRSQTSHLVGEAGHRVRERAESQVGSAARMLDDMSDELDRMASSSMSDSPLTSLARDGATAMRSISRRLDEGGLDAAMEDVRRFARRRPVVFLTGAFAIGMFAGRLVRNVDLGAVKQQARLQDGASGASNGSFDTGTTARIEGGMAPELSDVLATEAGMPLGSSGLGSTGSTGSAGSSIGSTDMSAGVEADWDAPTLQGSQTGEGSQTGRSGRQP
jgi:hypothetical protein